MEAVEHKADRDELKAILEEHFENTGSKKAGDILEHFDDYLDSFKKIIPTDYKHVLREIAIAKEQGADDETAKIEAFKALTGGAV